MPTSFPPTTAGRFIAYVRVLQRARHGTIDDVPVDQRGGLK